MVGEENRGWVNPRALAPHDRATSNRPLKKSNHTLVNNEETWWSTSISRDARKMCFNQALTYNRRWRNLPACVSFNGNLFKHSDIVTIRLWVKAWIFQLLLIVVSVAVWRPPSRGNASSTWIYVISFFVSSPPIRPPNHLRWCRWTYACGTSPAATSCSPRSDSTSPRSAARTSSRPISARSSSPSRRSSPSSTHKTLPGKMAWYFKWSTFHMWRLLNVMDDFPFPIIGPLGK